MTEADLAHLRGAGTVRTLTRGEELDPASRPAAGCSMILEGSLALSAVVEGVAVDLGVLARGDCVLSATPPAGLAYRASAREPVTVLELAASAVDALPADTRQALQASALSTAARRWEALASRHASLAAWNAELAARVRGLSGRTSAVLGTPALRRALSEIPALPVHATDLAFKVLDERTHADEIVGAIKNTPSLAGLVLKRVNSPYYGLSAQVSDYSPDRRGMSFSASRG